MAEQPWTGSAAQQRSELVQRLRTAERNQQPIERLTASVPDLDEVGAYRLQAQLVEVQAADESTSVIGLKLGLTSEAKQATMGVHEPIYGWLLGSRGHRGDGALPVARLIHPRIEPEVAVTLRAPLRGSGVTPDDIAEHIDLVFPAMEVIDSRYANFRFTHADVVADNTSAALWVVGAEGKKVSPWRLRDLHATFEKNGQVAYTATGAAILGDPLNALAWLANKLAEHGAELPAGQIILTGALTDAVPFANGDEVRLTIDDLGTLTVRASATT